MESGIADDGEPGLVVRSFVSSAHDAPVPKSSVDSRFYGPIFLSHLAMMDRPKRCIMNPITVDRRMSTFLYLRPVSVSDILGLVQDD
jgi:hypothetical protein